MTADEVKRDLHALVDSLPADAWEVARRVLAALAAQADYDQEPLTPEEEAAEAQGWQECEAGKGVLLAEPRERRA